MYKTLYIPKLLPVLHNEFLEKNKKSSPIVKSIVDFPICTANKVLSRIARWYNYPTFSVVCDILRGRSSLSLSLSLSLSFSLGGGRLSELRKD